MKHYTLIALFIFYLLGNTETAQAQYVTIPDSNFVNWLDTAGYAACMNGNQLDTTCADVLNTISLDCSYRSIVNLDGIQYFRNLKSLSAYMCELTAIPALPAGLTNLTCSQNHLTSLPPLPMGLIGLDCSTNQLTSLPPMPSTLVYFHCENNQLTALPDLSNTLITHLRVSANLLTTLPALPNTLSNLFCNDNKLTTISSLPNNLFGLNCERNLITGFASLPASLNSLTCHSNHLSSLPALPDSLQYLDANYNMITSLPNLPSKLISLHVNGNQLGTLPALPDSIYIIECRDCNLTSLPAMPAALIQLDCGINKLTALPALPAAVRYIFAEHNLLVSLPELPDELTNLRISYNPIACLPRLKHMYYFMFDSTNITCFPNYPNIEYSTPPINLIPLCEANNSNGCPVYWNIRGKAYFDTLSNCIQEVDDSSLANIPIQLWNSNGFVSQTISRPNGDYAVDVVDKGIYQITVDTANTPFTIVCPANGSYSSNISSLDSIDTDIDFALNCKPGFDLAAQSMQGRFRPGSISEVKITAGDYSNFYHAHCATAISGTVQLVISGPAKYGAAAPGALAPTLVTADTITWSIANFSTVNFFADFNVTLQTDTTAAIGAQICLTLMVNPIAGDNNPANNTLTQCFTVVGSFDPNIKEVYPAANINPAQKELTYTILFQNTGTAEAENIYVTDTLDAALDASTFQLLAYSHQPVVQLKSNNVRFNFPNINLPDSNTNEPLSHGYVQYKVKLKENLPIGTAISNTAYIYFDFNAPVVTNTTTNTIAINTGIGQLPTAVANFLLFPNPASNSINIVVDEELIGSHLTVTDITGRQLMAAQLVINNYKLIIDGFANGIYFVTIRKQSVVLSKKIAVNH